MAQSSVVSAASSLFFVVCLFQLSCGLLPGKGSQLGSFHRQTQEKCARSCVCGPEEVRCNATSSRGWTDGTFVLPQSTRFLHFQTWPDTSFPGASILKGLHQMRWLRVSDSDLLKFPSLPSVPTLVSIDISGNRLKTFSLLDLKNVPNLVNLNVSRNALNTVQSSDHITDLKVLDLSNNPGLHKLPTDLFSKTPKLSFLDISNANLSMFPGEWGQHLLELNFLNLSNNRITYIQNVRLPKLQVLDLSHNPLLYIPVLSDLPYVKQLFVSHTSISHANSSVLRGCNRLQYLDLSHSNLTSLSKESFSNCNHLQVIDFSNNQNLWKIDHGAFIGLKNLTILNLNDCPNLYDFESDSLNNLSNLKELNLKNTGIKVLPYSINKHTNLTILNIEGTRLFCNCYAYWLPIFLESNAKQDWKGVDTLHCDNGIERTPKELALHISDLDCSDIDVFTEADQWFLVSWGQSAVLECNVTGNPEPNIIWQTTDYHLHIFNKSIKDKPWIPHQISSALAQAEANPQGKFQVMESGHLLIRNVTREDIGRYKCFAFNPVSNSSLVIFLGLEDKQLRALVLESMLFGLACAALFLVITMLVQFINYVMDRLGWECCCCQHRLSPQAKQIRQLIESIEAYKSAQLDKLKENYTSQVVNIKDSCYQQMEKLRDSYAHQSQNLKDLCDYSTQQITGARDQYVDQVNKVRDYSMGQMNRVRENYVFQRHRIRKFSGHQLLRLRETYKYQQKTLNKLLETLPDLYIQNCRTGACQRTDSIIFDDQIDGLDVYYRVDFLDAQSYSSDYYTPNSTLTRQSKHRTASHSRNASTTSGSTEYQEAHSYVMRQESSGSDKSAPGLHAGGQSYRLHNRSNSIATPPTAIQQRLDSIRGHKRSISASSHPSPHLHHEPSLIEEIQYTPALGSSPMPTASTPKPRKGSPHLTPSKLTPIHGARTQKKPADVPEPANSRKDEAKTIRSSVKTPSPPDFKMTMNEPGSNENAKPKTREANLAPDLNRECSVIHNTDEVQRRNDCDNSLDLESGSPPTSNEQDGRKASNPHETDL